MAGSFSLGFAIAVYRSTPAYGDTRESYRAYATLEALPEARQNNVAVGVPYQHSGWIDQHVIRMDQAFIQAEAALSSFVASLDPWSGVLPDPLVGFARRSASRSHQ